MAMDPAAVLSIVGNPAMAENAGQVRELLENAVAAV